jgi:hypothetical protein
MVKCVLTNGFERDMVKAFLKSGKVEAISEYAKIKHPSKNKRVVASTYTGSDVRVYSNNDEIHLLYPKDVSEIQMESVAEAIAKGTIFDDADDVERQAECLTMTNVPINAMTRHGIEGPRHLKIILSGIIGRMSDDGTIEISLTGIQNGQQFMDQLKCCKSEDDKEVDDLVDHYLGARDHESLPKDLKAEVRDSKEELKQIHDLDDEEVIDDDDYEYMDMGDGDTEHEEYRHSYGDDETYEEAFFSKKPKRLKPIPDDIIAYIEMESRAIQDVNDQSMIAGYTCSKLELVNFYLTCIDTQDCRYIVPHTREHLVQLQTELSRMLSQILKVRIPLVPLGCNATLPEG